MPIYEYKCSKCGYIFEAYTRTLDIKELICPKCNEIAPKIMSGSNFVVKGYNSENNYSKKE